MISNLYAKATLKDLDGGVVAVIACGDSHAAKMALELGKSGNTVVHVIAQDDAESQSINKQARAAGLSGIVTAEVLDLKKLPYRNYLLNAIVVMDMDKAKKAGFSEAEAKRGIVPLGQLITCKAGKAISSQQMAENSGMDTWTHKYYSANSIPKSEDKVLKLTSDKRRVDEFPLVSLSTSF